MRALSLAVLFFLSACAPTLDDLIMNASNNGDWTAVNAKIAAEEESRAEPLECRRNFVLWCESSSSGETCGCEPIANFDERQRELAIRRGINRRQ